MAVGAEQVGDYVRAIVREEISTSLAPRRGRPPLAVTPMSNAERCAAYRASSKNKQKDEKEALDKELREMREELKRQGKLINDLLEEIGRLRDNSDKPVKPPDYKHSEIEHALLA